MVCQEVIWASGDGDEALIEVRVASARKAGGHRSGSQHVVEV